MYTSTKTLEFVPEGNAVSTLHLSPYYRADRTCMVNPATGQALSFGQVRDATSRFATILRTKFNVAANDVVLLSTINSTHLPVIHHAILTLGAIVSPANIQYTTKELAHQISSVKPKVGFASNVDSVAASLDIAGLSAQVVPFHEITAIIDDIISGQLSIDATPIQHVDGRTQTAYYVLSSGTSGLPKTVVLTHTNIAVNMLQWVAQNSCMDKPFTASASVLPLSHMLGLQAYLWVGIYVGTTAIVFEKYEMEPLLKAIDKYRIETMCVVPPIVLAFAKSPLVSQYSLDSLHYFCCAAAPLSQTLIDATETRLPQLKVEQIYGQSETSPLSIGAHDTVNNPNCTYKGATIGQAAASTDIRLVDPDTLEDSTTNRGEVWVRGPQVMPGYLNNPEANESTFYGEWLRTGDIAVVDENGMFMIVDRIKELIKSKGHQVAPAELEGLLLKIPDVLDCAVIGVLDEDGVSEEPRAYAVLAQGVDPLRVVSAFNDKVAIHKRLWGGLVPVEAVPKSPSGKILRRLLRDSAKEHTPVGRDLARSSSRAERARL